MERPGGGTIALDGQVLGRDGKKAGERTYRESELIQVRQRVGMVFQQFNLFPHMTAIGNVMEGLRTVRGMPKPEAEARARKELARVGLAEKADTYPAHLSGGQKQRVAIARALGDGPGDAAVRRADLGARSGAGRRGAGRHPARSPRKAAPCCWSRTSWASPTTSRRA